MADNQVFRTGYNTTLGMRGLHTWSANENPESWRETILYLYPNGSTPLTAITSKLKNVKEDNPHFWWFTKTTAGREVGVAGVYTDPLLTTPYVTGAVDGDVLYLKLSTAADANKVRIGHTIMLRDDNYHARDTAGKVTAVNRTGAVASTYIAMQLKEDDNGACVPANVNHLLITGNLNPEGSTHPEAQATHPVEVTNYQEITRNTLSMTRTAMQTKLRTKDQYNDAKKECLENHAMDIELALYYHIKGWEMGINGEPERQTGGIRWFIRNYAPTNEVDVARIAGYSGMDWVDYSKPCIDDLIRQSFQWGPSNEKLVLAGDGAMLGIQQMVEANAMYNITAGEAGYGIKVKQLNTIFGTWNIVRAPLLTLNGSDTNTMIVLEPKNLEFRYLQDTMFLPDVTYGKGGLASLDGKIEGYLTEWGLAMYFPETFMWINNVGVDSLV